ncbi:hypothetical protein GJ496_003833 [Pomphorhynchus laevis]|nr:hypothetical protein GJ496_003833 [Pomphorhynchus laevis]
MNFSAHKNRPAWREYNTRRFQNKMESLNLQEHQSELRLKAAQMTREQKIKNLNDRLQSQDAAIELMRQRHQNQTRDLKDLQNKRFSSTLDTVRNGTHRINKVRASDICPIDDLRQFTRMMDQRYERLKESKSHERNFRMSSEQPSSNINSISYRNVKEMLNHLPITPIFKETTCTLMGISRNSDLSKHDMAKYTSATNREGPNETMRKSFFAHRIGGQRPSHNANHSVDLYSGSIRDQRDVQVPMKDMVNGSAVDKLGNVNFVQHRDSMLIKMQPLSLLKTDRNVDSLLDKNSKKTVTFKRDNESDILPTSLKPARHNNHGSTDENGISLYSRKAIIFSK